MLRLRIKQLEKKYGGLRPAARVLKIDPAYLKRMRDGDKNNPSDKILKKLKLKRIVKITFEST